MVALHASVFLLVGIHVQLYEVTRGDRLRSCVHCTRIGMIVASQAEFAHKATSACRACLAL